MDFDYEIDAMKNNPTPKGLDIVDTYAYLSLKLLYCSYRNGIINRKDASKEKQTIINNMVEGKSKLDFIDRKINVLSKRICEASRTYKENPSIENADKLYAAFYNLPDDWRAKVNEENNS